MDGIIILNKPPGLTSHDAVSRIRRHARVKVGHTGTLDPAASGVLVLCLGKATRLAQFLTNDEKEYVATLKLGTVTTTDDAQGDVIATAETDTLTKAEVTAVFRRFVGKTDQLPPRYSAVRYQGKRLYELARQGKTVAAAKRPVTISALIILGWALPYVTFFVRCSKGTYIRSLCRDVGAELGVGGHLSALVRTRAGKYHLNTAKPLSALDSRKTIQENLLPFGELLADLPALKVPKDAIMSLVCGQSLVAEQLAGQTEPLVPDQLYRMFDSEGHFLALGKILEEQGRLILKPKRVFVKHS